MPLKLNELSDSFRLLGPLGRAEVIGLQITKSAGLLELDVQSDVRLDQQEITEAERALCKLYGVRTVRITPHCSLKDGEVLSADYISELAESLRDDFPIVNGFLKDAVFSLTADNRIMLTLQYGGQGVLVSSGFTEKLRRYLSKTFSREFTLDLVDGSDGRPPDYDGMIRDMTDLSSEPPMKSKPSSEPVPWPDEAPPEAEPPRREPPQRQQAPVGDEGRRKTVFLGRKVTESPTLMSEIYRRGLRDGLVVEGEVFSTESREVKNGQYTILSFYISDQSSSLQCKIFLTSGRDTTKELLDTVQDGVCLRLRGALEFDKYSKSDVFRPTDVTLAQRKKTVDNAEIKRVELHLHTTMSALDAVTPAAKLVQQAYDWGHKAVAITDHGVVQAFPEALHTLESIKKNDPDADFKVIYGIEAYLIDDVTQPLTGDCSEPLDGEFVVFDLETTGLHCQRDRMIEIAAILVRDGQEAGEFTTFVAPGVPLSDKTKELTGITESMLEGAPGEAEAYDKFMAFAGNRLLVAHNAEFDTGFLRACAARQGKTFANAYIDTLRMGRILYPGLKRYSLDAMARHLNLGDFNHHRALDDTRILVAIFSKMRAALKELDCQSAADINPTLAPLSKLSLPDYHCILLARNQQGIKDLYELVSTAHLQYFYRRPRMPKTLVSAKRQNLLIGSACVKGELYSAILDDRAPEDLRRIASFYDYLELQPVGNNAFLLGKGEITSLDEIKDHYRLILSLGRELGKPVVATGDVHFLTPADGKFREILCSGKKDRDTEEPAPLYFRTTDEMLAEFTYLDEADAREVVVDAPNRIADMIEPSRPVPKGNYPPSLEGSEEALTQIVYTKAKEMYGDPLPKIVTDRIELELTPVVQNGYAVLYLMAQKLVADSVAHGYIVGSRGSVGSTILAMLTGVSEVNPLPPHYYCKKCQHSEFFTDGSVLCGIDLPPKKCPVCGEDLVRDGLDIPFECFLGFKGDKVPDIDLNFSGEYQSQAHKYTEEIYGKENCFRAGTISSIQEKNAYGLVLKYCEENSLTLPRAEMQRLANGCVGVKQTTGQHPGGVVLVPRGHDITEFTPVQHPADDRDSDVVTTHFDFHSLDDTILKLDELGHDIPTIFKYLKDYTGIEFMDVPLSDAKVMSLFTSTEALGVSPEAIETPVGTYALPEMGTELVRQMLVEAQPKTFADLLQISGLSHGKGVWLGNAQELIRQGGQTISTVIGLRDDIMLYLIRKGVDKQLAFKIMEYVRKKPVKILTPEFVAEMKKHDVPQWYMDSCNKIEYMFPKAHAAAYVISALRMGWFKVYKPQAFYAAYFTVRGADIDYDCAVNGLAYTKKYMQTIRDKGKEATKKEQDSLTILQIVMEMFARGISFAPVDLHRSDARRFLIDGDAIRLPFSAMNGIGENAAALLANAVKSGSFATIEEFGELEGVTQSMINTLREAGALGSLPESNQLSLF